MKKWGIALAVLAGLAIVGGLGGGFVARERARAREQRRIDAEARCRAQISELRAWLSALATEGEVDSLWKRDPADPHHYLTRPVPPVALVRVRAPSRPVFGAGAFGAALVLERRRLAFDDETVDVTDAKRVDAVVAQAESSGLTPSMGFGGHGRISNSKPISLLVGEDELWSDVADVVGALGRRGFGPVNFVFAIDSKITPPADNAVTRGLYAIATNQSQMPWKRLVSSAPALAAANPRCPSLLEPAAAVPNSSVAAEEQQASFAARAADLASNCGCEAVDIDSIKAFAWTRYGRHWGQLTTGVLVENVRTGNSNQPIAPLAAPPAAKWRDVHQKIIEASRRQNEGTFAFSH